LKLILDLSLELLLKMKLNYGFRNFQFEGTQERLQTTPLFLDLFWKKS